MTLLKLTLSLVLTTLVADVAHAQGRCTFLPKYQEDITLLGHQKWADDGLRLFPADEGVAYTISTGFTAIGGEVANGCVTYPKAQAGVQVDLAQFATEAIDLSDKFTAKLVYPKGMNSADVTAMRKMLAVMADKVGQLYPLGFNPADKDDFYIVATAGLAGVGYLNTQRIKTPIGKNLGMLALPPKHPDFDAEVIRLLVDMYTKARPHPLMGPKDRSDKRDLKIDFGREIYTLDTEDYDALVAGWATIALAADKDHALERLYNTLVDYAGYIDNLPMSEAQDLTLSHIQNSEFAEKWKGLRTAGENDAYFYTRVASVVDGMRLAAVAKSKNANLGDIFKEIHKGELLSLTERLGEVSVKQALDGYKALDTEQLNATGPDRTFMFGYDVLDTAQALGYVDIPKIPGVEEVFSQGALLDTRLYQQSKDKLSDKVYLVTTFQLPLYANASVQPLGYVLGNTIRELLKKGDVLVVARSREGVTKDALRDSYSECRKNEFDWSMRKAAIHMRDTVGWLKYRGYEQVYGIGFGKGALALLAAAGEPGLDKIYGFNPWRASEEPKLNNVQGWRGRDYIATRYLLEGTSSAQCGGEAFLKALETVVKPEYKNKVTVFSGNNMVAHLNQYDGWLSRYKNLFETNINYNVGQFAYPWSEPAFHPDLWIDKVK